MVNSHTFSSQVTFHLISTTGGAMKKKKKGCWQKPWGLLVSFLKNRGRTQLCNTLTSTLLFISTQPFPLFLAFHHFDPCSVHKPSPSSSCRICNLVLFSFMLALGLNLIYSMRYDQSLMFLTVFKHDTLANNMWIVWIMEIMLFSSVLLLE